MIKYYSHLMLAILLLCASVANAQVSFSWANGFGGSASANAKVRTATDGNGNVFVTGIFEGTKSFGTFSLTAGGIADAFLAKYDANGTCLWARNFGGSGTTQGYALAVDAAGYVYVTGTFTNTLFFDSFYFITAGQKDAFIVKFDGANGNSVWCQKIGGQVEDTGEGLALDNNGNLYITGTFNFKVFFSANDSLLAVNSNFSDSYMAKYDTSGNYIWSLRIGGTNLDQGLGIAYTSSYIFACGSYVGTCQFGNGISLSSGGTGSDSYLAKYDLNGVCQWAKKGGGPGNEAATAVSADVNGYPTITGFFVGNATFGSITLSTGNTGEMFVVHYDPSGNTLWAKQGGGNADDGGFGIACDTYGYVLVCGAFQGNATFTSVGGAPISVSSSGQSDGFVSKYTPSGKLQFVIKISGTGIDNAFSAAFVNSNNYYIAGNYTGTATLDTITLTSVGVAQQNFIAYVPGFATGNIEAALPQGFVYYPNPVNESLFFQQVEPGSNLTILNTAGQVVFSTQVQQNTIEINTHDWMNGFYIVRTEHNKEIKTGKLVVVH